MHFSPVFALLSILSLTVSTSAHRGCSTPLPANLTAGGPSQPFNITSGGRNRSYLLHIPTNYDINTPAPLIISYHGAGETPAISESSSLFSSSVYNQDFVVAYPAGVGVGRFLLYPYLSHLPNKISLACLGRRIILDL